MTATFQSWGLTYDWSWFLATIAGILLIALPLMLAVAMIIYAERKIWAAMALRRGSVAFHNAGIHARRLPAAARNYALKVMRLARRA